MPKPVSEGDAYAIEAYNGAARVRAAATLVASDALHILAVSVIEGRLSLRQVARATGLSKSKVERAVERARSANDDPEVRAELARLDAGAYCEVFEQSWGVRPEQGAPFVVTEREDGSRVLEWRA